MARINTSTSRLMVSNLSAVSSRLNGLVISSFIRLKTTDPCQSSHDRLFDFLTVSTQGVGNVFSCVRRNFGTTSA
jgi:hypothetical protein